MAKKNKKMVEIFEGVEVPALAWLAIAMIDDALDTIFKLTMGGEIATGRVPVIGGTGTLILFVLRNWGHKIKEWKAKNDTPNNSINTVITETTPKKVTETNITESI